MIRYFGGGNKILFRAKAQNSVKRMTILRFFDSGLFKVGTHCVERWHVIVVSLFVGSYKVARLFGCARIS